MKISLNIAKHELCFRCVQPFTNTYAYLPINDRHLCSVCIDAVTLDVTEPWSKTPYLVSIGEEGLDPENASEADDVAYITDDREPCGCLAPTCRCVEGVESILRFYKDSIG